VTKTDDTPIPQRRILNDKPPTIGQTWDNSRGKADWALLGAAIEEQTAIYIENSRQARLAEAAAESAKQAQQAQQNEVVRLHRESGIRAADLVKYHGIGTPPSLSRRPSLSQLSQVSTTESDIATDRSATPSHANTVGSSIATFSAAPSPTSQSSSFSFVGTLGVRGGVRR
jgi:hypothetical protein